MQKQFIIPVSCKNCGRIFDLWEDLVDEVELDERLCRNCRAISIFELMDFSKEDNSFIANNKM